MRFARSVCADNYIETFGEFQVSLFENREIPDPQRLEHWLSLL